MHSDTHTHTHTHTAPQHTHSDTHTHTHTLHTHTLHTHTLHTHTHTRHSHTDSVTHTHTHTRHTTGHNFLWLSQWFCDPQYYLTRLTSHSIYNTNSKRKTQTHKRFKRTLIYSDTNPHSAHFRGNPLCQAAEWHLTIKLRWKTVRWKMRWEAIEIISFIVSGWALLFSCLVLGRLHRKFADGVF